MVTKYYCLLSLCQIRKRRMREQDERCLLDPIQDLSFRWYVYINFCSFISEQFIYYSIFWVSNYTTSWGCWKHPLWIPGVRPMFLRPKLLKQSKNGFKTICCRRYPLMIFSKNCFSVQNNHQKIRCFVDFWIFMAIYIMKLDKF